MKQILQNSISVFLLLLIFSCQENDKTILPKHQPSKLAKTVVFADGFEIQPYQPGLKKLYIFDLSHHRDTIGDFWLVDASKFKGKVPEGKKINVPVKNFACRSTTHLAFFNFLKKTSLVKGVCYADYANNPLVKKMVEAGEIKNLTAGEEIDLEILASLSPQIFTTYPYGNINKKRIESLRITILPILEYLEDNPLKRAEWVKLFGALLGEEKRATQGFNTLANDYRDIYNKVKDKVYPNEYPTVFTGSLASGKWSAPSGKSLIAKFIKDAGGKYIFEDNKQDGNIELEYEEFYAKALTTDYWGKVVYASDKITKESLLGGDHRLDELKAVKNNAIFYCNATKTDYFGDAIMQPQVILQDLVNIFHPQIKSDTSVYFKRFIP